MIRNEDTDGSAFFLSGQYLECNFFFVMGVQQLYTLINNSETGASAFQFVGRWSKWSVFVSVVVNVNIDSLIGFFYNQVNMACLI